jgi:hypothetical protein
MAFLPIDENLDDGDQSVPDLGFNGSVSVMMAFASTARQAG